MSDRKRTTTAAPGQTRDLPPGEPRGEAISIELDGHPARAFAGEPLAVALWADDVRLLARSTKFHRPRGPFCFAGHCASCTMRVDGRPSVRACLVPVRAGLRCERQNAFPDAEIDVLRAADWLFPHGMDHHHLMTGTRIGNELFVRLVRELGGSGTLPDDPAAPLPASDVSVDLLIVGAGPAGLGAAAAARGERAGLRVLVVDEQSAPGGSLLAEPAGVARAQALSEAAVAAGARILSSATATGFFREDGGVLAVVTPGGLLRVRATRVLYATGGYDQNLPFADNDVPDVISARGCGRLAFRWGVRPGRRVLVAEDAARPWDYAARLTAGLDAAGVRVTRATLAPGESPKRRAGMTIAVAALPAPAFELARQHGAEVRFVPERGGFAVLAEATTFATTAAGVHAVGDVTGYVGPDRALADGRAAGRAIASAIT